MKIALGCMRLSTEPDRDEARGLSTLAAALDGGVTTLDTAHAYGIDEADAGHNERLVARALSGRAGVRVVTKCGMRRPEGRWVPDGRASAIEADARASAEALGRAPDVLLLHAPDPRVPLERSVRALARVKADGLATEMGLSNVSLPQLEEAVRVAPIAAVEVALGAFDDACVRGGLVPFCAESGILVLAHSPLGGPKRAGRLARDEVLSALAAPLSVTPAALVLAYLAALHPCVVPLAGARREETAVSAMAAGRLSLDANTLDALDARFPGLAELRVGKPQRAAPSGAREVVLIMGLPGAGKSRVAEAYVARGYTRFNRDERGGSLRALADSLDEALAGGTTRAVVDNTYLTRASRADVLRVAARRGARVRCLYVDTPAHEAQRNVASRALRGGHDVRPTSFFRMVRELEPPAAAEGFSAIEVVPFVREEVSSAGVGAAVALDAVERAAKVALPEGPVLVFAWRAEADTAWLAAARAAADELAHRASRLVELALCTHAAGPPVCWCRPPLPGLWLAFAARHRLRERGSVMVGASPAHGTMARALGLTEA